MDKRKLFIGLAIVCLVIVVGYFEVPFEGGTFSTSAGIPGVEPCSVDSCFGKSASDPRPDAGASAWQTEPWAHVVHRALSDGELPLWNPYEGAGTPLAGDPPTAAFDPLLLALHLHPTPLTQDATLLVLLVLIGLAAYWAARVIGLAVVAATVAGSIYGLSGWFFSYSNNEWFSTYLYLPLILACVEWCLRSRRLLPVVLLAAAVGGMFLVGMPELAFISLIAAGVYSAIRLFVGSCVHRRLVAAARLLGGVTLGLLLAAPMLALFAQYVPLSQNTHSGGVVTATDSLTYLVNWMMPKISPGPAGYVDIATNGDYSFSRNWVGAGAVVLMVVAFSSPRALRRYVALPIAGMGAFIALQVYGGPLVHWTHVLPGWGETIWPRYATPVIALSLALLAGIGVQAIANGEVVRRRLALGLGLLGSLTVLLMFIADRDLAIGHAVERLGGWPLALLVAAAIAIACFRFSGVRVAVIVGALVVIELLLIAPRGIYPPRTDPYPNQKWASYLTAKTAHDRSRIFSVEDFLYPDTAGVYGLQDPRMLDALYVERYWHYLRSFVSLGLEDRFTGSGFAESAPAIDANPMFDLLGVRYLVYPATHGGPPTASLAQFRVAYEDDTVRIFENLHVMPRAFVVHDVKVVPDESAASAVLATGNPPAYFANGSARVTSLDPRRTAVVEADPGSSPAVGACTGLESTAKIVKYTSASVTVDVDSECAGLLVLSDAYYPGWTATVNGRDSTIYPTDVALRGVAVPEGRSTVVFRYRPPAFRLGLGLAGLALLIMLALIVLDWRSWRRSRHGERREKEPGGAEVAVPQHA